MKRALIALFLAAALPLAAVDLVEVSVVVPWVDHDGYSPVVVTARCDHDVVLRIIADHGRSHGIASLALAAGVASRCTVLVPASAVSGNQVNVHWTSDDGQAGEIYANAQVDVDDVDVLMLDPSEALPLADLARRLDDRGSTGRHGATGDSRIRRMNTDSLPSRWQAWPTWLTIVATAEGDSRMDGDQRRAIADWTRAGGELFVANAAQVAGWRALGVAPVVLGLARAGDGAVIDDVALTALDTRISATQDDRTPRNDEHKVPGTERAPIGGFAIVAGLFALLVGPVNLWWVRRRDARHLFLITTPLLSLATCIGLLAFNLIAEGVAMRRSARQIAIVDQTLGRAVVWTAATYFGGFAAGDIALDPEAKLMPFEPGRSNQYDYRYQQRRESAGYGLDWREGQLATGGWIPARVNRHLSYAEPRPLGDRVIVTRDGAGWNATNGFAHAMTGLRWRDAQGRWWGCDDQIEPGGRVALTLQPEGFDGLEASGQLLQLVRTDAGAAAMRACTAAAARPHIARAMLAGPVTPLPGPSAEDAQAVTTLLLTIAAPE